MKKRLFGCLLALVIISAMGCSQKNTESDEPGEATLPEQEVEEQSEVDSSEKELHFCFAIKNLTNPYFIEEARGVQEACDELGITVDIQATNADTEVDKQLEICENFLATKPDAIIIAPLSSTGIVPFVKNCNDAGVPVINVDTAMDPDTMKEMGASVVTTVITDNYAAGVAAAEAIIEELDGKGKILVLEGTSGAQTAEDRKRGFLDTMEEKGAEIEIVDSQPADYNRNKGYEVFTNMFAANPNVDALFAANDEMALGALQVMDEYGKAGEIKVVGINFSEDAKTAMKDGKMLGSVNQDPYMLGRLAALAAYHHITGTEEVDELYMTESIMMYVDDIK